MCDYYEKCTELARLLTEWAMSPGIHLASGRRISGVSRYSSQDLAAAAETVPEPTDSGHVEQSFVIGTGGGPGFMEAANKGAAMVPGAKTIGVRRYITIIWLLTYTRWVSHFLLRIR